MSQRPDIEALHGAVKVALRQGERAMHELGRTHVNIGAASDLDSLAAIAREEQERAERFIDPEDYAIMEGFWKDARARAESAEARLRVAMEALRRLDGMRGAGFSSPAQFARHVRGIARAAIAKLREEA